MHIFPKISVITFVYISHANNRLELLKDCMRSISEQNYPNYEHIIIDDGSDVDLTDIVEQFPQAKLYKKENTGILSSTYTFNLGHQLATGDYCIYLGSDDMHLPGALFGLANALQAAPTAVMAIGHVNNESKDGKLTIWKPNPKAIANDLDKGNYIHGCAVMWRRSPEILELLPPNYTGFCADYDLFVSLSKAGTIIYPEVSVVQYRHVADSTRNKTRSNFIVSSRKGDGYFYQYSKKSRVEFVQTRCHFSLSALAECSNLNSLASLKVDDGFVRAQAASFMIKRDWQTLHEWLKQHSESYRIANSIIENRDDANYPIYTIEELTLSAIVLMQYYRRDIKFHVIHSGPLNDWRFDYCPIPAIDKFINADGQDNIELAIFLGMHPDPRANDWLRMHHGENTGIGTNPYTREEAILA